MTEEDKGQTGQVHHPHPPTWDINVMQLQKIYFWSQSKGFLEEIEMY